MRRDAHRGCDRGCGAGVSADRRWDGSLMLIRKDLPIAQHDYPIRVRGDI